MDPQFLARGQLDDLIRALRGQGYRVIGPRAQDGVIGYAEIAAERDLPRGWHDAQGPGRYRLVGSDSERYFAWANGPQAIKPYLFAQREPLWRAKRVGDQFQVEALLPRPQPLALLGVRACDLAALGMQDKLFLGGAYADPYYAARAEELLLIAVNCSHPAATCFCASTGDGPAASTGFDLVLTELEAGFVVEAGSVQGQELLELLPTLAATASQMEAASRQSEQAARSQTRGLPGRDLRQALFDRLQHPRWDAVAARCLGCGNCTMVCPTCFCHAEQDVPTLNGGESLHQREWDSCFSAGHGYIHGFQVRPEIKHRYRQWLTHKFGSWHEQFGRSGCVGCGRCISWCPVGIDVTEETRALMSEAGDDS
jgi:ferredoxin